MAEVFPHTVQGLNSGSYCAVVIPKEQGIKLELKVDAARPQGLAIYGPDQLKYEEWYSTANLPNSITISGSNAGDVTYYLAGFAFYPGGGLPGGQWIQSKIKNSTSPEFDDYMNDGDFNDLVVMMIPQNSPVECPPRRPGEEPPDCPQE